MAEAGTSPAPVAEQAAATSAKKSRGPPMPPSMSRAARHKRLETLPSPPSRKRRPTTAARSWLPRLVDWWRLLRRDHLRRFTAAKVIVLAGNGMEVSAPGIPPKIWGGAEPLPSATQDQSPGRKQKHPGTSGFVLRLSPDGGRALSAARLGAEWRPSKTPRRLAGSPLDFGRKRKAGLIPGAPAQDAATGRVNARLSSSAGTRALLLFHENARDFDPTRMATLSCSRALPSPASVPTTGR